ncbi:hypothetical protein [Tautonia sociabilis]|uniref:Uncharacterized protein n=1 Tax=Tautonia sociabilis TaxID=2080755 RepID=A0A432MH36_9BACT|nr:hypothetical protein [Tautonia sociabilis]RUL86091.1 hypothetical protein TsocGM_16875 [Tautonia sociabilis]
MPEGSDPAGGPDRRASRRFAPLAVIGLILAWLLVSGGRPGDWIALRGPVPGTGGMLAKGHLVLIALILIIAHFVFRMPRQGGPISEDEGREPADEGDPDDGPAIGRRIE